MAIVKMHDKRRDITYVYESISYWDKSVGQPRSRRKLLGRLDPETGDIVPTGRRGRPRKGSPQPGEADGKYKALYEEAQALLKDKDMELFRLGEELRRSERRREALEGCIARALEALGRRHDGDNG